MHRLVFCAMIAWVGGLATVPAQTPPTQYYYDGAFLYTGSENEKALAVITEGLKQKPGDIKLIRLKELIEKQQQQQQQQQQKDQQNQQQNKDQQDQQPQNKEQNQDKQQQDQPQQPQDQAKPQDQPTPAPDQPQDAAGQPEAQWEEMTPDEARMMLDAIKDKEQADRERMRMIMGQPIPVDKDW